MATLLPNAKQTFFDQNGVPLAGGSVTFYVPGTSTLKDTYQDAGQTQFNTNPAILDAAGSAVLYGAGVYRQVVKDAAGNIVWDQNTADTSSTGVSWGGTSTGAANLQVVNAPNFSSQDGQTIEFIAGFSNTGALSISPNGSGAIPVKKDTLSGPQVLGGGEVVAGNKVTATYDATAGIFHVPQVAYVPPAGTFATFAMAAAPQGYLFCDGSGKSRTTFAALFAAIGTTYGAGDGTTTFNLPDARGRVLASIDGGAGRLTVGGIGTIGSGGGEQQHLLAISEMPAHDHGGNTGGQSQSHTHPFSYNGGNTAASGNGTPVIAPGTVSSNTGQNSNDHTHSIAAQGASVPHNNVQPTLVGFVCIKT